MGSFLSGMRGLLVVTFIFLIDPCIANSSHSKDERWIASMGAGLMLSPDLALFSTQLEIPSSRRLYWGPLLQLGLGSSTLITASWAGRYHLFDTHPLTPYAEGALGLAGGRGDFGVGIGIHAMVGIGLNYKLDDNIDISTSIRGNLCPPLKLAVLTWPLLIGRFAL